jgi:general secretion pathway protein G
MQVTLERLCQRREEMSDEGGLTLIELLIIIVVLGILAGIVIFAVQNLAGNGAQGSCASDLQTVDHAAQAYIAQVNSAPANVAEPLSSTTVNGQTVGPLLHNTVGNGNHHTIEVAPKLDAQQNPVSPPDATITVTAAGAQSGHTYLPDSETPAAACTGAGIQ